MRRIVGHKGDTKMHAQYGMPLFMVYVRLVYAIVYVDKATVTTINRHKQLPQKIHTKCGQGCGDPCYLLVNAIVDNGSLPSSRMTSKKFIECLTRIQKSDILS